MNPNPNPWLITPAVTTSIQQQLVPKSTPEASVCPFNQASHASLTSSSPSSKPSSRAHLGIAHGNHFKFTMASQPNHQTCKFTRINHAQPSPIPDRNYALTPKPPPINNQNLQFQLPHEPISLQFKAQPVHSSPPARSSKSTRSQGHCPHSCTTVPPWSFSRPFVLIYHSKTMRLIVVTVTLWTKPVALA
ncbi:hypothetical protein M0R45_008476 [Rubus argutus]|uniref:Uncharacterized protein n=1 Tax=Rubus argutus TaxID=59490 RepID=A0AAW1Y255_RUBAR